MIDRLFTDLFTNSIYGYPQTVTPVLSGCRVVSGIVCGMVEVPLCGIRYLLIHIEMYLFC